MKVTHKRGMDTVQDGLLKMREQEENWGSDFLAHVFWGVLDDSCRHFNNTLSREAALARYIDLESVRLPGIRLGHMAVKLACNKPLINVSVPKQWLGRGATPAAGYQSVRPIGKYQGGWKPPKNQADYGHHLVVVPENEVHGQVGQLQTGATGIGKHMAEREKK